jgi:MFS family permease
MRNVRDYAIVTAAYWAFTLTDGALRMLVLLHLHDRGYEPLEIASLFLFYEFFGVVTNLFGGWLGARVGLKLTLFAGLALQVFACAMLAAEPEWLVLPYVMAAQGLSGVAKDLTKMSSKSYVRLVVPDEDRGRLMRWVAVLTGSKNALKGVGFFLGGASLAAFGFRATCAGLAAVLVVTLVASMRGLPAAPGRAASKVSLRHIVSSDPRINWLSAARLFLFGSRDVWFVLALPLYLTVERAWSHPAVGAFLALWVIFYGVVQGSAPHWVGGARATAPPDARRLMRWTLLLLLPTAAVGGALSLGLDSSATLVTGLAAFAAVFASSSAIHSYLIVSYADRGRVALNVGFYYMANASGRLVGTLLSGAVYQAAGEGRTGLVACLAVSLAFVAASAALCAPLRGAERRGAA